MKKIKLVPERSTVIDIRIDSTLMPTFDKLSIESNIIKLENLFDIVYHYNQYAANYAATLMQINIIYLYNYDTYCYLANVPAVQKENASLCYITLPHTFSYIDIIDTKTDARKRLTFGSGLNELFNVLLLNPDIDKFIKGPYCNIIKNILIAESRIVRNNSIPITIAHVGTKQLNVILNNISVKSIAILADMTRMSALDIHNSIYYRDNSTAPIAAIDFDGTVAGSHENIDKDIPDLLHPNIVNIFQFIVSVGIVPVIWTCRSKGEMLERVTDFFNKHCFGSNVCDALLINNSMDLAPYYPEPKKIYYHVLVDDVNAMPAHGVCDDNLWRYMFSTLLRRFCREEWIHDIDVLARDIVYAINMNAYIGHDPYVMSIIRDVISSTFHNIYAIKLAEKGPS